jgi:pyruvate dehydrogenase E2 component (dihydrolipoamide acetyltransferase)
LASKDILVPDLGDFKDVAVIEVMVKTGDSVQVDTPLLTLETEKATIDVPSTDAGVIQKLHVAAGSKVSTGTLIATLQLAADAGAPASAASKAPAKAAATPAPAVAAAPAPGAPPAAPTEPAASAVAAPPAAARAAPAPVAPPAVDAPAGAKVTPPPSEPGFASAHAGPSVRRFARELGVDLGRVKGSGQKGRITDEDVKAFVKSLMVPAVASSGGGAAGAAGGALPRINVPDFSAFGAIDVKPLGRVQRISGARLHASWVNLPHVTQFDEADVTELEQLRKSLKGKADAAGIRLTTLAFIVRACVKALQQFPLFNTSIDASGENLVYKRYFHIGFAADTPNGLLVPVIRDTDRKDIYEIARALGELSAKARAGKLSGAEMQGGCFTISSLGGIGGTAFTPIINAPEVAILGVSRASMKPVFRDDAFVPRLILPLSLSYDHRVIDGANGARFTSYLAKTLADAHGLAEAVP